MQRNQTPGRENPRKGAERDAAQPMAGQPRSNEDEEHLQEPEAVPSFLTARELQARDGADGRKTENADSAGERHASASFEGEAAEPPISDDNPPRGDRGKPLPKSDEMLKKGSARKSK